jgi:hypothetical protein
LWSEAHSANFFLPAAAFSVISHHYHTVLQTTPVTSLSFTTTATMADNEEELVDYDEEEVRDNHPATLSQNDPSVGSANHNLVDPLAWRISHYSSASTRKLSV